MKGGSAWWWLLASSAAVLTVVAVLVVSTHSLVVAGTRGAEKATVYALPVAVLSLLATVVFGVLALRHDDRGGSNARLTSEAVRLAGEVRKREGTAQPDPHPKGSPEQAARPGTFARHRGAAIAALVALVLLVGAGTSIALLRSGGDTNPPATAGPLVLPSIAITGNPKAADPCALLDLAALRQFGIPRRAQPDYPSGCKAAIDTPSNGTVELEIDFTAPTDPAPEGEQSRIGDVLLTREPKSQGPTSSECKRVLTLTDQNRISVGSYGKKTAGDCVVAEVGLRTVLARLKDKQITYTPGRAAAWSFSTVNACDLLSDSDIRPNGIDATVKNPDYANWGCIWGTQDFKAEIDFRLDEAMPFDYGTETFVDDRRAWSINEGSGYTKRCRVFVVSRPAATPQSATEILETTVTNTLSNDDQCKRATDLAAKAVSHLPAP